MREERLRHKNGIYKFSIQWFFSSSSSSSSLTSRSLQFFFVSHWRRRLFFSLSLVLILQGKPSRTCNHPNKSFCYLIFPHKNIHRRWKKSNKSKAEAFFRSGLRKEFFCCNLQAAHCIKHHNTHSLHNYLTRAHCVVLQLQNIISLS